MNYSNRPMRHSSIETQKQRDTRRQRHIASEKEDTLPEAPPTANADRTMWKNVETVQ